VAGPFTLRSLTGALLRRRTTTPTAPTEDRLAATAEEQPSEIGNLAPPIRDPRPLWATDAGYVEAARQLLTVMGARVGGRNRIAQTMARAMGASQDPAGQLQQLRGEAQQVLSALGELRKVQGQVVEEAE
jgi:hypothetical protein